MKTGPEIPASCKINNKFCRFQILITPFKTLCHLILTVFFEIVRRQPAGTILNRSSIDFPRNKEKKLTSLPVAGYTVAYAAIVTMRFYKPSKLLFVKCAISALPSVKFPPFCRISWTASAYSTTASCRKPAKMST